MDHWKHFLEGMRRVLVIEGDRDYVRPQDGFLRDAEALRGDGRKIAQDLQRVIERHDQPTDHCKA